MQPAHPEFVNLLHRLTDAAGDVIRRYFRQVSFENKEDASPVTVADQGAEEAIRNILKKERPLDGVWGEEYGHERMDAEFCWIIDPIDGTKSFIRGMATFATLIGLMHKGAFVLGVVDQPIMRERWVGGHGLPTTMNGKPVHPRACAELKDAVLNATAPVMFKGRNGEIFAPLEDACKHSLWGGDAYAYGLLTSGYIDIQVDTLLKLHDYAALVPVIEAAGGRMTDWKGQALKQGSDGRVIAVGDPRLLEPALRYLRV
jgi:inositol-phosphate phosphatase/L-galactose 1-phosphate phosphatase/histidinol-phosphatase